jgi:hypothetical protein
MSRYRVPALPIREMMQKWLENEARDSNHQFELMRKARATQCEHKIVPEIISLGPMEQMIVAVYPEINPGDKVGMKKARNRLEYVLRESTNTIDFDLADLVLCRLDHPEFWMVNPVLRAAYVVPCAA